MSYAYTFHNGIARKRFGMNGFQVLTVTTSQDRINAIQSAMANLSETYFSANTFLFTTKDNKQFRFPFHSDWQNSKGAFIKLF